MTDLIERRRSQILQSVQPYLTDDHFHYREWRGHHPSFASQIKYAFGNVHGFFNAIRETYHYTGDLTSRPRTSSLTLRDRLAGDRLRDLLDQGQSLHHIASDYHVSVQRIHELAKALTITTSRPPRVKLPEEASKNQ